MMRNKRIEGLLNKSKDISISNIRVIDGNATEVISTATTVEKATIKNVSKRNCFFKCHLLLPKTFRTPTSFDRLTACAVERFIKLVQAINRINAAINQRILIR